MSDNLADARLATPSQRFFVTYPVVRPLGTLIDKPEYVKEVWNAFVKPEQDAKIPPSIEMRMLMAILRSVHHGLAATEQVSS